MLSKNIIKIPKIKNINEAKNNSSFSPTSKDSNYSLYTKEQSITNYLKFNKSNHKTIDNSNESNLFKEYNKSLYDQPNKIYFKTIVPNNNNSNKNIIKINNNKNKNIFLNSLFNLPTISPTLPKSYKHSIKNVINRNNIFLTNNNNLDCSRSVDNSTLFKSSYCNTEEREDNKLEHYMKNKFYEDIEKKMNNKLNNKIFCHDNSIKDKIIKLNKIGVFWGSVFEYCNPLITTQKYRCIKNKQLFDDIYNDDYKQKINNQNKPILFTHNLINKLRHKEKIQNEILLKKEKNLILNK